VTRITLQDGKVVLRDGQVGTEEACCCEDCASECGQDCPQTVTVNVSVAGYATQLAFTVTNGFGSYFENFGLFDFLSVSAFIFCALIDGCATWTLVVTVCWQNGANIGSEDWEGIIDATNDGCPKPGGVPMNVTFGNGDAVVTASIA
jgi:hypothetical protein